MASHNEDELAPSTTEGFKLGEKKTVDEYAKLGKTSPGFTTHYTHLELKC